MVVDDLRKARRALAQERTDEALLFLWNALEPARLEGGGSLRELEGLAASIAARGDESQKREAERLLADLREERGEPDAPVVTAAPAEPQPVPAAEAGEEIGEEDEAEPQKPAPSAQRRLVRYLLPLFVAIVVLVNVLRAIFGGD